MKKAVLLSLRPEWCEKILTGEKTIEIRKTKPKLKTPFKCYIYCTKPTFPHEDFIVIGSATDGERPFNCFYGGGKVLAEFTCYQIFPIAFYASDLGEIQQGITVTGAAMTDVNIIEYLGNGKTGYGWHISDLKIYDEPKALSEFFRPACERVSDCGSCPQFDRTNMACSRAHILTRAPQSWCYVGEV